MRKNKICHCLFVFLSGKALYRKLGELIPKLKSRQQRQGGGDSSSGQQGKGKKGKKGKRWIFTQYNQLRTANSKRVWQFSVWKRSESLKSQKRGTLEVWLACDTNDTITDRNVNLSGNKKTLSFNHFSIPFVILGSLKCSMENEFLVVILTSANWFYYLIVPLENSLDTFVKLGEMTTHVAKYIRHIWK